LRETLVKTPHKIRITKPGARKQMNPPENEKGAQFHMAEFRPGKIWQGFLDLESMSRS